MPTSFNGGQVIELVGRPGAGKTFMWNRFRQENVYATLNVDGDRNYSGWSGRIRLMARQPLISVLCYLVVATRRRRRGINFKLSSIVQVRWHNIAKARASRIVIVDEGPLHGLAIALYGTRKTVLSTIFLEQLIGRLTKRTACFALLDVDPAECVARLEGREPGLSRFHRDMTLEQRQAYLEDQAYSDIVAAVRARAANVLISAGSADTLRDMIERRFP